jgi:hypothetical protein
MAGRILALLVCVVGAFAATAHASTLVPMSDRELTESVAAIVEATVIDVESLYVADRQAVYTYVTVDVERTLKGDVPPGMLVLRQLGGATTERATVIFGAPEFDEGERVVLFLNADEDGALHVAHLRFGLLRVASDEATGEAVVRRDDALPELSAVTGEPVTGRASRARFVEDVVASVPANDAASQAVAIVPPEYLLAPHGSGATSNFTFLGSGFRWFEPDTGGKVRIKVNKRNAPSASGGVDEAKAVFRAWSAVSSSELSVAYDGSTDAGGLRTDGVAVISFADPRNQIDDLVNCQGIVALAGLSASFTERITIGNKTFARITESDLVVNNGIECLVGNNPVILQEILAHEFGHDLGLGHSSENPVESNAALRDATMYFVTHNDGRGASLREDDAAGIRFLYPRGVGALAVSSGNVPDVVPNEPYSFKLEATGGTAPYTWSITSGALPNGLALATNGLVSGTATLEAANGFTVRVQDAAGASETRDLVLEVTRTPSPYLTDASYSLSKQRLTITGRYLDATAAVTVNNVRVAPPAGVSYRARKMRLTASGAASNLNVKRNGNDAVYVTISGRPSNTVRF